MCDAADIKAGETVFEIGPGTGALTKELLSRGATVVALEADLRAIDALQETFATEIAAGKLKLRHGDARELDLASFHLTSGGFKVVANIPYYLSGLLFRKCLDTKTQPNTLVFLIQKELAERIARDKKESLLSLSVKVFGKPEYITTVKRGHFTPSPKVDSAILKVSDISRTVFENISSTDFFSILHAGFGQKRKQLQHNLRATWDKERVIEALKSTGLPETVRAEDIALEDWLKITKLLAK